MYIYNIVDFACFPIYNGNRTELSPIRYLIIRVITKSDDHEAGVRFVKSCYQLIIKITISEKKKKNQVTKGKICTEILTKEA